MTAASAQTIALPTADTPVAAAAVMYAELGFMVIPLWALDQDLRCTCQLHECKPRSWGKHPTPQQWEKRATSDVDKARDLFRGHRGNIGIMLGKRYVAIDADGPTGLESLKQLELPETLTAVSGSGEGGHFIFQFADHQDSLQVPNRSNVLGKGSKVDVKTNNGQIVVAPSLHRSGNRYRWTVARMPALLPDSVYDRIRKQEAERPPMPTRTTSTTTDGEAAYKRAAAYVSKMPAAVSGENGHAATFNVARNLARFSIRLGLSRSDAWSILCEYNRRCEPSWSERELEHKFNEGFLKAHTLPEIEERPREGLQRHREPPKRDTTEYAPDPDPIDVPHDENGEVFDDAPQSTPANVTPIRPGVEVPKQKRNPTDDWKRHLIWEKTKDGTTRIAKHHGSAVAVLRYHPRWAGRVRLNTHAQMVTVCDPPWFEQQKPHGSEGTRPWLDSDSSRLSEWIKRELWVDIGVLDCERAVEVASQALPYHPVKEWMETLEWDGENRLATAPATYFGVEASAYAQLVFRFWMISAVARTYVPGEKVDHVLILEGGQGLRKSSALRVLAGADWFTDTPIDLRSKDAFLALNGKLIVELGELDSLRKVDNSRQKAFFTSQVDFYRPPYARRNVAIPRGCVFAGTVNPDVYLNDPTGARRYWPLRCTSIDLEALQRDREQLWAEAVAAYLEGALWHPATAGEDELCKVEQEQRTEVDPWEERIAKYYTQPGRELHEPTMGDVLTDVLQIDVGDWDRSDEMRVAAIMGRLGYERKQKRAGMGRNYRYVRVTNLVPNLTPLVTP